MNTMTATDSITTQAAESVALLLAQGRVGDGQAYDIGTYSGDIEALEARLARDATRDEIFALEQAIAVGLSAASLAAKAMS